VAKDIDTYLRELQSALAGADPALIQDALFDAEEHLQAELAARGDFSAVAEGYGSPEEVAAAYMGTVPDASEGNIPPEPTTPLAPAVQPYPPGPYMQPGGFAQPGDNAPAGVQHGMQAAGAGICRPPSFWRGVFGVFADGRVWTSLVYMLLSLGTGIVYFTIVVTGLSTAGGMLVLIIGIPLLMGVLGIVRAMALFEGRLVEVLLGTRMPRRLRPTPPGMGFFQRMVFWLKDGRTWASMVYMLLMLPLGVAYFTIAVTGLSVGISLATVPIWGWFVGVYGDHTAVINGISYDFWPLWAIPIAFVAGVLLLIGFMHLVKWIGRGHAILAKAMLVRLAK
jgi:hypothetical protein